jgi:O-glycosyl hydrolase
MKEALLHVGRKFKAEGINTKIYLPEVLPAQRHVADFFNAVANDKEGSSYADIFAIHNYDTDGINVGGASAKEWKSYSDIARSANPPKELWMTETSGHPNTWQGAMLLAANMYNALNWGNINAWCWWALADKNASSEFALIVDGQPSGRYYVSKHFYRFVRPDAVRVDASSNNDDVLTLALKTQAIISWFLFLSIKETKLQPLCCR